MDRRERCNIIEAILFVAGEPVLHSDLERALDITPVELDEALGALQNEYDFERRGMRLLRFGQSVQMATRPDYAQYIEKILQPVQKQSLSQAAMETLAVIAYKQPATRGEIEQIRGVKCDYSVQSLLNKGLIQELGRKETLGRPMMFGTTDAFLRHFGIASLDALPPLDLALSEPKKEVTAQAVQQTLPLEDV
ncbi:MAG TPA: SMC-Scp complex subunit ScpB [Clostridia bacterium]|nr:SMC-Scp complex subunit ScpB [Clostridia bacterium]